MRNRVADPHVMRVAAREIVLNREITKVDLLHLLRRVQITEQDTMTPQEEAETRVKWRKRRTMKGMARLARWRERESMKMIAPDHRRWCTRTCRWYDDRETK